MDVSRRRWMIFMALALLLPVLSVSCGGELGTSAGGGTGGTGVGPVTGFGSVIVNGVHYDDSAIDDTNFFDGHGRTKADLKVGMMVAITGSINGTNGRADDIAVLRSVDGPMDDNAVDLTTNRLKVMGQDVVVELSTVFDGGVTNLADLRILQGANVNHPELEVHGSADNNGRIHATFIHKWADDRVAGRPVQVKGTVSRLDTGDKTFSIGRLMVDYDDLGSLPDNVSNGSFVEVKGTLEGGDNLLVATLVGPEDATGGQPTGSKAEVEGYVNRVVAPDASFELIGPNGVQTVTWIPGTTEFSGGTGADIRAGVKVEVEGTRKDGGALTAAKIEIRRTSNVRMQSTVTSVTASALTIFGKAVKVNALTEYEDDSDIDLKTFGQANIEDGNTLEVVAFLDDTGALVATRVKRIDAIDDTDHVLQGPVDSIDPPGGGLKILGITVNTIASPGTRFFRADGTEFATQGDFFAAITVGAIVEAEGTRAGPGLAMDANEVEIEPTDDD